MAPGALACSRPAPPRDDVDPSPVVILSLLQWICFPPPRQASMVLSGKEMAAQPVFLRWVEKPKDLLRQCPAQPSLGPIRPAPSDPHWRSPPDIKFLKSQFRNNLRTSSSGEASLLEPDLRKLQIALSEDVGAASPLARPPNG